MMIYEEAAESIGVRPASPLDKAFLECIPVMVERAENVRAQLSDFVGRFEGPQPTEGNTDRAMPPACHRTHLDRLSHVLGDIEELARSLRRIG